MKNPLNRAYLLKQILVFEEIHSTKHKIGVAEIADRKNTGSLWHKDVPALIEQVIFTAYNIVAVRIEALLLALRMNICRLLLFISESITFLKSETLFLSFL